jgi:mRNA-degrading endonuclease RelE of RelBE toxin-antitoxin system
MDKIKKSLEKLSKNEREKIKDILIKIGKRDFRSLDVKKLKGRSDIFRICKGQIRIIYRVDNKENIFILTVERRSDITYKR